MPRATLRVEQAVALTLLALLATGCVLVVRPLATALLVAVILTVSLAPVQAGLVARFGGRRGAAALCVTLLCILAVALPLVVVGLTLSENASLVLEAIRTLLAQGLPPAPAWLERLPFVGPELYRRWQMDVGDPAHLMQDVKPALDWLRGALVHGGALLARGILQFTVALLIAFFLLRDGGTLAARLEAGLARLVGAQAPVLLNTAGGAMRSVVYGLVGTAAAQGAAAAFALLVAGVPGAILLGFLTFVAAFIPFGSMLVWAPAALWLLGTGAKAKGIFLAVWGVVVLLGMDKLLKPVLMSRGLAMPLVLVVVGVLGGAVAFGFLGLFIGPTLLALAWSLASEWTRTREAVPATAGAVPVAGATP